MRGADAADTTDQPNTPFFLPVLHEITLCLPAADFLLLVASGPKSSGNFRILNSHFPVMTALCGYGINNRAISSVKLC
jgi:hypothetical protein